MTLKTHVDTIPNTSEHYFSSRVWLTFSLFLTSKLHSSTHDTLMILLVKVNHIQWLWYEVGDTFMSIHDISHNIIDKLSRAYYSPTFENMFVWYIWLITVCYSISISKWPESRAIFCEFGYSKAAVCETWSIPDCMLETFLTGQPLLVGGAEE